MNIGVQDIAAAFTVGHIQTPVKTALPVGPQDSQGDLVAAMAEAQFDATPVFADQVVVGYARQRDMRRGGEPVSAVMRPLTAAVLVQSGAPIDRLLQRLLAEQFLLVVDGDGISGLVTPSDLNKQAGRTF